MTLAAISATLVGSKDDHMSMEGPVQSDGWRK